MTLIACGPPAATWPSAAPPVVRGGPAPGAGLKRAPAPAPAPTLVEFVDGLLADTELRACLGGAKRAREHYLRLGYRRVEVEGREHDLLEVTDLVGDYEAQNCINERIARVARRPAVTGDTLSFVLVDDPDAPALGYREMRTGAGAATVDGVRLELVGGSLGGAGFRDGAAQVARFDIPLGLAADGDGHLFVGDAQNRAIRRVDIATGRVDTVVAVSQRERGVERQNLHQPTSLAFDPQGRLHALDALTGEIWRIEEGAATRVYQSAIGAFGTERDLNGARSMVFDRDGTVLVADSSNHRIVRIDLETGSIAGVAGEFGKPGHRDGKRPRFHLPEGLALGPDGTLYVSEYGNNTIRALELETGRVRTVAGRRGKGGHADGVGKRARFDAPSSLAYLDGSLYVAESYGLVVRRVDLATRRVTTIAGTYRRRGAADGTGARARFDHHESSALGEMPYGMAVAGGQLFLADSGNHVVRRIEPGTGAVATLAGKSIDDAMPRPRALAVAGGELYATAGQALFRLDERPALIAGHPKRMGHDDGVGRAARFRGPHALAALSGGRLAVGEVNGEIRVVDPERRSVRTLIDFERILEAIVADADDRIYAAMLFEIARVTPDGRSEVAVARSAEQHPDAVIVPNLYEPIALALDGDTLYLLDVRRLYSGTPGTIATLRRVDLVGGGSDALATWIHPRAGLRWPGPTGLAVAADGSLWIAHSDGALIQFDPDTRTDRAVLAGPLNRPSAPLLSPDGELLFIDEGAVLASGREATRGE